MRTLARLAVAAALSATLGGCLSFGSIQKRGAAIDDSIGVLQNRAILLNLVRASRHEPLYFISINSVNAEGIFDFRFNLPPANFGPDLTQSQRTITFGADTLDNSTNTSFQVGVYNTRDFYSGLMQPLGLTEVDLLLHQGFSRELIFYLVIEKAKLTDPQTGKAFYVYNNPADRASYGLFVQAIASAMTHGLTTEVPIAAGSNSEPPAEPASPARGGGGGPTDRPGHDGDAGAAGPVSEPELCFERALATDAAQAEFSEMVAHGQRPNFCGQGRQVRKRSQLTVRVLGKDYEVEVTTRSIFGIFSYLGSFLARPDLTPQLVDYGAPSEATPAGPLLDIARDADRSGCFTEASYDGRAYCVPEDGSETTKSIFNVLTMLVALKQKPGDLPASATLLIQP